MSSDVRDVFAAALALTDKERAELANLLLDSLDDEPSEATELSPAWEREIERRVENSKAGRVKTIPWPEVQDRLRAIVDEARER